MGRWEDMLPGSHKYYNYTSYMGGMLGMVGWAVCLVGWDGLVCGVGQ